AGVWPRVRPHAPALAAALAAVVASAAVTLAFPLLARDLLDAAFVRGDRRLLDRLAAGLTLLLVVQAGLTFAQAYLLSAVAERVVAGLRRDLFAHLVRLPPGFFAERQTGELASRLSADVGLLQSFLSQQLSGFTRQGLLLLGGLALLVVAHPRLTGAALAVGPVVAGVALLFGRRLARASAAVQDRLAEATAVADEVFGQIRVVQAFGQEAGEVRRFGARLDAAVRAALRRAALRGLFFAAVTFATFAGVVVVLWQGGRLVFEGALTAGALVSFLLYTVTVAGAVGALAGYFGGYQEAVGAARRVFELLGVEPAVADPPDPVPLPRPVKGEVRFERVSFRYAPGAPWALREVTVTLVPGEVVALVGPSGAGKTTLTALLLRFWDPTEGRILLDGIDLRRLSLAELRGAIGLVPQEPLLFGGTVRDNIAYGRPGASDAEIEAAARAAHAAEFIERLPLGYATPVGERGLALSAGQRQRIAIARVLLKDPALLILDEATSALDAESERLVERALERLMAGRTTLIIAHRLSTVRRAGRVVVLDRGRLVEEGSHEALLARRGLYERLYRRQFRDGGGVAGTAGGTPQDLGLTGARSHDI
ncbi:MAG TPA: ABC transporter transmembrane domain-containing protein, partial [Thermodesulfobacteriota bacterium]|nr:ABC transporter transmembrane domain-containing protein [Thermodesulfobacteriota bacterium]